MTFEELLKKSQEICDLTGFYEDAAEILNENDCVEIFEVGGDCADSCLASSVFHHIPSGRFLRLTNDTFQDFLQNVVEVEPKIVTKTDYVNKE